MNVPFSRQHRIAALVLAITAISACQATSAGSGAVSTAAPDPLVATYLIEKESVTLVDGRAERAAAPGSATKVVTTLAAAGATGDVDGDGRADAVVVLVQQPGGSGTFSYLAVLLNTAGGVAATPAVMLGDRIAVTGLRLDGRTIVIDLLDRAAGQPLSASPSVAVTKRFTVDAGALRAP